MKVNNCGLKKKKEKKRRENARLKTQPWIQTHTNYNV